MTTRQQLTPDAKATLRAYGISQAAWLRLYPDCDRCGCPDDRCIGYHHDTDDECDMRVWLEEDLRIGRLTPDVQGGFA